MEVREDCIAVVACQSITDQWSGVVEEALPSGIIDAAFKADLMLEDHGGRGFKSIIDNGVSWKGNCKESALDSKALMEMTSENAINLSTWCILASKQSSNIESLQAAAKAK